jgi:predicted PurR-regulated permease PerM
VTEEEPSRPVPTRITFGFTTALAVVVAIGAALVLAEFVSAASQPLGWAIACAIVAALVQPIVSWLSEHMRRGLAVLITVLGLIILLGGAWAGTVNTIADNVETLKESAPLAAAEIEADSELARDFRLEDRVTAFTEELDEDLGTAAQLRRSTSTLSTYVVTGVLTVFFIGYGRKLTQGAIGQIRDEQRRDEVVRIMGIAFRNWTRYALVALAQVVVFTLVSWIVLWALDLPAAFVLAIAIGGFSAIPFVGTFLGGVPALLFAAGSGEVSNVVIVLALVLALQLVEIFVIRPRVDSRTLYLGAALPLIAALIGYQLYGIGGAVYGVILLILVIAIADAIGEGNEAEQLADATP